MKPELLDLMHRIFCLQLFLEALYKTLGGRSDDDPIRETARLTSDIDEVPEEVREAVTKWARAKNCSLNEVPVILAAEAYGNGTGHRTRTDVLSRETQHHGGRRRQLAVVARAACQEI